MTSDLEALRNKTDVQRVQRTSKISKHQERNQLSRELGMLVVKDLCVGD